MLHDSLATRHDLPRILEDIGRDDEELIGGVARQHAIDQMAQILDSGVQITWGDCQELIIAFYDGFIACWDWMSEFHNHIQGPSNQTIHDIVKRELAVKS